jgi:hypothetical protein
MAAGVVFHDGYVYTGAPEGKNGMAVHVYDGQNGKRIYGSGPLPHAFGGGLCIYPSPVTSARHAFVFNDYYCAVLEQGPTPRVVAINGYERMFAGVFLDGDRLYLRTYDSIICIGPKGEEGAAYAKSSPTRVRLARLAMAAAGRMYREREAVKYIRKECADDFAPLVEAVDRIGGEKQFANCLALLPACLTERNRHSLVPAVARRLPDAPAPTRARLLRLLPALGDDRAMDVLVGVLNSGPVESRMAAAHALGEWPNTRPLPELEGVARSGAEPALRTAALRSSVSLLVAGRRDVEAREAGMTRLAPLAEELGVVPDLIAAATNFPPRAAIGLLGRFVRDARYGERAAAPMIASARAVAIPELKTTIQALHDHARSTQSAPARRQLEAAVADLKKKLDDAPPRIDADDAFDLPELDF